jgi:hypothetical protein
MESKESGGKMNKRRMLPLPSSRRASRHGYTSVPPQHYEVIILISIVYYIATSQY